MILLRYLYTNTLFLVLHLLMQDGSGILVTASELLGDALKVACYLLHLDQLVLVAHLATSFRRSYLSRTHTHPALGHNFIKLLQQRSSVPILRVWMK